MTRNGKNWPGFRWWVFWRHFWQHRRENLFVLLILTLGFLFYIVYGAWTTAVSSPAAVEIEPPIIPADVMVRVPAWTEQVAAPNMDPMRLFEPARLQDAMHNHPLVEVIGPIYRPKEFPSPVRAVVPALSVPVMTPGGTTEIWGVEDWAEPLEKSLELQQGRWPGAAGEIAVHIGFAQRTGVGPGSELSLLFIPSDELVEEKRHVTVVGVYGGEFDLLPELMAPLVDVQELTHLSRPNLVLAWSQPVPDHIVETGPPQNETRRYPMPQLEDLLGQGLRGVRLPTIGWLPPGDLHPVAQEAQFLLPFGLMVDDQIYINGSTATGVLPLYTGIAVRVSPITLLIFLSEGIALTVVLALVVVDRQRLLGTYRVLGLSGGQLRRLYFLQVVGVGLVATVLGVALFWAVRAPLQSALGMEPELAPLTIGLWLLAVLTFALWSGHVAGSLYETTDIDSLLRANFAFDWWSIVRLGLTASDQPSGELVQASGG